MVKVLPGGARKGSMQNSHQNQECPGASTLCSGLLEAQAESESWPRGPQATEGTCRIFIPPFPGGESFFSTKKLKSNPVALSCWALQDRPKAWPSGKRARSSHSHSKKRWCLFPWALWVYDLQRQKWAGRPEDSWSTWGREAEALSSLKSKCLMSQSFTLCYILLSLSRFGLWLDVRNTGPTHKRTLPNITWKPSGEESVYVCQHCSLGYYLQPKHGKPNDSENLQHTGAIFGEPHSSDPSTRD